MQDDANHCRPAEAHEQARSPSTANNVAVLWPRSVAIIKVPEYGGFPNHCCHIWHIYMCRRGRIMPANEVAELLGMRAVPWCGVVSTFSSTSPYSLLHAQGHCFKDCNVMTIHLKGRRCSCVPCTAALHAVECVSNANHSHKGYVACQHMPKLSMQL